MDRRRAAGCLLALAACFAFATAAPTASNHTALDLYDGAPDGCYYNFQHYGEGDRIMTNEPCLNCTCHNRMLMCYLRVCPFTKPIGQDCTIEKRADQCCPIVTCPDVPVDLLTSTTNSPAEYGATGLGKLDKYGCSIHGKYFPEGSKVPPTPNKPCEHCYCIRNMTTCVMQECTLHVDGCTPIYHKDVCCPVRYSCDHPEDEIPLLDDMSTTVRPTPGFLLTTTTLSPVTQMSQDCVYDSQLFPDGALIKTEKACDHCYCMKGDIVCVVQECGTPMENEGKNCTALPPREGVCCPDTYICEGDEPSTESYDENQTTDLPLETLTTLTPPRRAGSEGSGYRNEDTTPYTETPIKEPEVEGSGDEQESIDSAIPTDNLSETEEPQEYITVASTRAPSEQPKGTTAVIDSESSSTELPHEQELGSGEEEGDQVTEISQTASSHAQEDIDSTSKYAPEDEHSKITQEPESQVQISTTSSPYVEEKTTDRLYEPETSEDIEKTESTEQPQMVTKDQETQDDIQFKPHPATEISTPEEESDLKPQSATEITTPVEDIDKKLQPATEISTPEDTDLKPQSATEVSTPEEDSDLKPQSATEITPAEEDVDLKQQSSTEISTPEEDSDLKLQSATEISPTEEDSDSKLQSATEITPAEEDSDIKPQSVTEVSTPGEDSDSKPQSPTEISPVEEDSDMKPQSATEISPIEEDTDLKPQSGTEISPAEEDSDIKPQSVTEVSTQGEYSDSKPQSATEISAVEEDNDMKPQFATQTLPTEEDSDLKLQSVTEVSTLGEDGDSKPQSPTEISTPEEDSNLKPQSATEISTPQEEDIDLKQQFATEISTPEEDSDSKPQSATEISPPEESGRRTTVSDQKISTTTADQEVPPTPQQYYPSTSVAPSVEDEVSTDSPDVVTERAEEPELEPHPHYGVTSSTPMLEEIEKETTEYSVKEPTSSDAITPTDISTSQPISESIDKEEKETQKLEDDISDYITTMNPLYEKDETESMDIHKVSATDGSDLQYTPTTLSPIIDEEDNKVSSEGPVDVPKDITTGASQSEHSESTTSEPDKGLNTIPGTLEEEHTIEPSNFDKTTISDEKPATEENILTETKLNDIPESSTLLSSIETSTKEEKHEETSELITTTAEKITVSPTRIDGVQTESSPAVQHTESSDDITAKPTYETTRRPDGSETDRDVITEATTANLEENEIFNEPRIPGEGDCLINGVTYRNESSVPSTNKCLSDCKCVSSIVKCDPIICSPPPEYMENCRAMYDPTDSCCPTYVCDHKTETMPPQPHSQMSGTETPSTAPVLCQGDECEIQKDKKPTDEPSKPCASGNCQSDGSVGATVPKPETDIQCTEEGGCHESPITSCQGDECKSTFDKVQPEIEQYPTKEDEISKETCQGQECKIDQQHIDTECKDGNCRRKDGSDAGQYPSIPCSGSDCRQTHISPDVETSTQKEEYPVETDKPESDSSVPSEESTEVSKLPVEPSSQYTTTVIDKSEDIIPTTAKSEIPQEIESTQYTEVTTSAGSSPETEITKLVHEYSTESSLTDVEETPKPTKDTEIPSKSSTPSDIDTKSPDDEKIIPIAVSETPVIPETHKETTSSDDDLSTLKEESYTEPSKIPETDDEKSSPYPSSETTTVSLDLTEDHQSTPIQEGDEGKKATTKAIEISTESYESPDVVTAPVLTDEDKIFKETTDASRTSDTLSSEITHAPEDTEIPKISEEEDVTRAPEGEIVVPTKSHDIYDHSEPSISETDEDIEVPTKYDKDGITTSAPEEEEKSTTIPQIQPDEIEKTTLRPIIQEIETEAPTVSKPSKEEPYDDAKLEESTKPSFDEDLKTTQEIVTQQYETSSIEPEIIHSTMKEVIETDLPKVVTESSYDHDVEKSTVASESGLEDKFTHVTEISSVPKVTVIPELEDKEDIFTVSPVKSSTEESNVFDVQPDVSTKSPDDEITIVKETESTLVTEEQEPEKEISPSESSDKISPTEKVTDKFNELPSTDMYEESETQKSPIDMGSQETTSLPIGLEDTTQLEDELTTKPPSKFENAPTTKPSRTSEVDSEKSTSVYEESQETVTKSTDKENVEPSATESVTEKESVTRKPDQMTELPIKSSELDDKDRFALYDLATEKATFSPFATDITEEQKATEPGKTSEDITPQTNEYEHDKYTTKAADFTSTESSQINEEPEISSRPAEPSEDVTSAVTIKEEDFVTSKIKTEASSTEPTVVKESESKVTELVDESELEKFTTPLYVLDGETVKPLSEEITVTPSTAEDLVPNKVPLSPQDVDHSTTAFAELTTEASDKLIDEGGSKTSPTTTVSNIQTTEPTRKFESEPEKVTISTETSASDESVTPDTKVVSDTEIPATVSSVITSKPQEATEQEDIEVETSTKLEESESYLPPVTQNVFTTRPITDLLSSESPQEISTEPSTEYDHIPTDSAVISTEFPDVPHKEDETSEPEKEIMKPSDIDKSEDITTELSKTPSDEKPEDIPVQDVVETTVGIVDETTPKQEDFVTSPKTELAPESIEPAEITTSSPVIHKEVTVTTDKYEQLDIAVQTEKEQEVVESFTMKQEPSTPFIEDGQTIKPTFGEELESPTPTSPFGGSVSSEETPEPAIVSADSDKTITPDEPIAIPVQTERIPDLIEKPSPDEDRILSTTKATTVKAEEELATTPSDKFTKPEAKPIEPSATPAPEQPKPIPSEPTDELPSPDEDAQFPPSGPNSYGQEPDYMEEDQTFGPGTCRYGGKVYVSAQQIPRDDPCDFCFCFRSDIICLQQSCPPPIHGCHEEPIQGFCCPRYECPVSMATTVNVTTTTTTTTTTLPPHFPVHSYKGSAQRKGCLIKGQSYKVGDVVRSSSGPCLHCTCGGDGQMKCDPKACTPEPMLRQMIAAAVSAKRRR